MLRKIPYEVIVSNSLYEQQDYVVETNHLPHLISLIVNDDFFQNLSREDQDIMTQAANGYRLRKRTVGCTYCRQRCTEDQGKRHKDHDTR